MANRPRTQRLLLGITLLTVAARDAGAQCTTRDDANAVRKSINLATKCNNRILRSGSVVVCKQSAPPACAGTLVADATRLGYGPNDPPAAAVDRSAARFVGSSRVDLQACKLEYSIVSPK